MPPEEKLAPVQGFQPGIPWSMHLRAYDAYCKRYGPQKGLIEGWCRGGFGTGELDMFIPGWREEISVLGQLKAEVAELRKVLTACRDSARDLRTLYECADETGYVDGEGFMDVDAITVCAAANIDHATAMLSENVPDVERQEHAPLPSDG
jgi:hypothetical protein